MDDAFDAPEEDIGADEIGFDDDVEDEEPELSGNEEDDGDAAPGKDATAQSLTKEKVTSPYMTKFERARVIGTRALQLSMNAPVTIPLDGETDPLVIAEKELYAKTVPFIVRR
eukprot:GHVO01065162.1.p1 GENE.GHVO01065162.1~~GHVO01065162.1.p1  ORF type:complete len:113 (-),score=26.65 GHVO01065162.1:104-442(-)